MKKEVLISVLIGLSLGLIITYGVYRFRVSMSDAPTTTLESVIATSPSPDLAAASVITIHSPEDGTVTNSDELTVTGNTVSNAYVVLFVNDNESISTSDAAGNFSFQVKLSDGPNIIRVHVVDESGQTTVAERSVIMAGEENSSATPSAETVETETKQ